MGLWDHTSNLLPAAPGPVPHPPPPYRAESTPFSQRELDLLYSAAKAAVEQVKEPHSKTYAEVEGAIYTTMRRELAGTCLFPLFNRTKKSFTRYPSDKTRFVEKLVEDLMPLFIRSPETTDDLKDLRLLLAAMRQAQGHMEQTNREAERVAQKLLDVQKTLDPSGENNDE